MIYTNHKKASLRAQRSNLKFHRDVRLPRLALASLAMTAFMCLLQSFLFAQTKAGKPGAIWDYGAGARAFGVGRAYTAMVDDATAGYWNSAALADIGNQEIMAVHSPLETGASYDYLGYAYPLAGFSGLGVSVVRIGMSGFEERDANNSGLLGSFSYSELGLGLAYGRRFGSKLLAGSGIKVTSRSLPGASSHIAGFDMAALYKTGPHSQIGLNMQNLSTLAQNTDDKLPLNMKIGYMQGFFRDSLKIGLEYESLGGIIHLGTEYTLPLTLALSPKGRGKGEGLSIRSGIDSEETAMGIGYNWKNMSFDYALGLRKLGSAHRIGIGYGFGRGIKDKRQELAKKAMNEALAAYQNGLYLKAREQAQKAVNYDTEYKDAQELDKKLAEIIQAFGLRKREIDWESPSPLTLTPTPLPEGEGNTKNSLSHGERDKGEGKGESNGHKARLVKSGLSAYLSNDFDTAALFLDQALAFDPKDKEIRNLFNTVAEKAGRKDLLDKPQLAPDVNIAKRLAEAEEDFWAGRYELGAKKCEEVIVLDPDNVLARTRLGSLYYALGLKDKAIQEWETALKISPNDNHLLDILKKVTR